MRFLARCVGGLLVWFWIAVGTGHALEVKISPQALERTLKAQLFNQEEGRYYIRGSATSPCYVYAEDPKVSFKDDRVVVHVTTHAKLGTGLRGACLGISLNTQADVSVVPEAQGESIGFRDAKVEKLSESKELNFLLVPFLSRKLPQQMKLNAADVIRKLLAQSVPQTGYTILLNSLTLHSMMVDHDSLVVDVDAAIGVQ